MNLEDESENVKIGKAIHEEKCDKERNREIIIDNIKLDKLTTKYLTETKKSDADIEAAKWQLLYYLKILKSKGIIRKGKLEIVEKNKQNKSIIIVNLTDEIEQRLNMIEKEIIKLIDGNNVPEVINDKKCKQCAYYAYCYL